MSATAHPPTFFSGLISRAVSGALAGIAGGIVYGVLLVRPYLIFVGV
jgi:membrane associated rhomboid family serine protease